MEWINITGLIAIATSLIAIGGTVYTFHINRNSTVAKERLDKVFAPLFEILHDHLYRSSDEYKKESFIKAINQAKKIITNNSLYFSSYLRELFEEFLLAKEPQDQEKAFMDFSSQFLSAYISLCKSCGLPGITIKYRRKHKLYKRKAYGYLDGIWFCIKFIYFLVLFVGVFIIVSFIVYKILKYSLASMK